jgi:hypothetical protein
MVNTKWQQGEFDMKQGSQRSHIPYLPLTSDKSDPLGMILTDTFGSYTGRPENALEEPVQDADDL